MMQREGFEASHACQIARCFWQVPVAHFGILIWPTLSR